MMKPVVLRFALVVRWLPLSMWGLYGLIFFMWAGVGTPWSELLRLPYFWALFTLWVLLFYALVWVWNYKVIFGNTHLVVKTLWFPFFKPFSCAYEDIRWVMRGGSLNSIKIVLKEEIFFTIFPQFLDGGEARTIKELKARIKPETIMSEVEVLPSLWGNPSYRKPQMVVTLIFIFLHTFIYLFILLPDKPVAWKYIKNAGLLKSPNEYSVAADGSVWTVDWKFFDQTEFIIRHTTGNEVETWEFKNPSVEYLHQVVGDGNGNPWVFDINTTFHWEDGQWIEIPYPTTVAPIDLYWRSLNFDGKIWALLEDENSHPNAVFEWNLATNESTIIDLPQYDDPTHSERLRLLSDGTLVLLRTYANLGVVELYELVNQTWEKFIAYPAPENVIIENAYGMDATLDRSGQFWFLFPMASRDGYYAQRLNAHTNIWETTEIAYTEKGAFDSFYRFEVDARERVWAASYHNIFVFLPNWGESAELLVYYNDQNSGANGGQIWLDTDGKMWAPHDPYWIDTNTERLPRPLPDWLHILVYKMLFAFTCLLGIVVLQAIISAIVLRRAQRENTVKILHNPS